LYFNSVFTKLSSPCVYAYGWVWFGWDKQDNFLDLTTNRSFCCFIWE